ncbi:MAG: DNA polymerase III subunit gamma/tau [Acidiferrobacterales bacterium]|nr:DNA polymerase III subunit gamma/tau [Acidiferrobacterales bacterium]
MSYLVLARKWRPRNFEQIVGQEHVVRTLRHALDNERLHHAYLFTGTRGVGKTTLARILAKALNCEKGVSSKPCNDCGACTEIDEGRFIDLIEVDAASRTKVEDTRALLDNVPFSATAGRYKVYLIDEIHMLSGHSFNALLKTLEEPPEHVKFLMATTDPQKLPVTILSRCIQFNLSAMDSNEISAQMIRILEQENIDFSTEAVDSIARQSRGSMRDGLSILDQAISYTNGKLEEAPVREMLGMLSQDFLLQLLTAIADQDPDRMLEITGKMSQQSVNYESALDDILLMLHELSLLKAAPQIVTERADNINDLKKLESQLSKEEIQLYYQIALIGKRDLPFAPDTQTGFQMALMRMLAFHPAPSSSAQQKERNPSPEHPKVPVTPRGQAKASDPPRAQKPTTPEADSPQPESPKQSPHPTIAKLQTSDDWLDILDNAGKLSGPTRLFAKNLSFRSRSGNTIIVDAPDKDSVAMDRPEIRSRLEAILREITGDSIELVVENGANENETLSQKQEREHTKRIAETRQTIIGQELPSLLMKDFGAKLEEVTPKQE